MKRSAGILVFRKKAKNMEYLLAHPGGPFYAKKDDGSWSIPKGEYDDSEDPFEAAIREFNEETGISLNGNFMELKPVKQNGGKYIHTWAIENDADVSNFKSNEFELEWPPKSGKFKSYPEIDRLDWFVYDDARKKILKGQIPVLDELKNLLEG
jgi:predicted NUDIX family NTP pyrophosphohydrolase